MTNKRVGPSVGEGERLEAERRKRIYKVVAWLAGAGALGGFMAGLVGGYSAGGNSVPEWMLTLAAAAVVLSVVIGAYACWRYYATVDEVEVTDNLWGAMVGFSLYAFVYPAWVLLDYLGRAPAPHHAILYAMAMLSGLAAYAVRKWRAR